MESAVSEVEEFLRNPSVVGLRRQTKANLLRIAKHYDIDVDKNVKKEEVRKVLLSGLAELGVLVRPEGRVEGPEPEDAPAVPPERGPAEWLERSPASPEEEEKQSAGSVGSAASSQLSATTLRLRLARLQREREANERRDALEVKRMDFAQNERKLERESEQRKMESEQAQNERKWVRESEQAQRESEQAERKWVKEAEQAQNERKMEYEHQLASREQEIRLRELDLRKLEMERASASATPRGSSLGDQYGVSRLVALPPFKETEVDAFFSTFERLAAVLKWPAEIWTALIQGKLTGKAQDVVAALSVPDSQDYQVVKAAVLRAYELVPEAYRQQFRGYRKRPEHTFVEFAREKEVRFDKWCAATKASDYKTLRELLLLEEFKQCVPERCVMFLNEQKVHTLFNAAVLADEYVLTHKHTTFPPGRQPDENPGAQSARGPAANISSQSSSPYREMVCRNCNKKGHISSQCNRRKEGATHPMQPKPSALIQTVSQSKKKPGNVVNSAEQHSGYKPFVYDGVVSASGVSAHALCP